MKEKNKKDIILKYINRCILFKCIFKFIKNIYFLLIKPFY